MVKEYNRQKSKGYYSQNRNGKPHDKNKNGPGSAPPNSVKKDLKKHGWDWDGNIKKYAYSSSNLDAWLYAFSALGVTYVIYRGARMAVSALPPFWWTIPANIVIP